MSRFAGPTRAVGLTVGLLGLAVPVHAHAPSVNRDAPSSPGSAVVLEDPTLSRAIGATIGVPGEVDWYRMDLAAGEPLVVGMTAPDAEGALAATFIVLGPGLPDPSEAGGMAEALAQQAAATGALRFEPASVPAHERHAGLGFLDYGMLAIPAPADGSYYVAVFALDPAATGKYVLAPGVREEFGIDAIPGMADLIGFFNAPWPSPSASPEGAVPGSQESDGN
jgi:hypothetical protein